MEKITDYLLKDFLTLENPEIINEYVPILELLSPMPKINDPLDKDKIIQVKQVRSLMFGEVTNIRNLIKSGGVADIIEAVGLVTKLSIESIYNLTIIPFYSIVNGIHHQVVEIDNMEINELSNDDEDIVIIEAQANERMSRFGVLNTIDSLAGGDITKWSEIEKLPYMVVFTKLMMIKTTTEIKKDVRAIQQRQNNK